jgi:hypothetical protein
MHPDLIARAPPATLEYVFKVRLVATVRVRAADEAVARRILPSVLSPPSTEELRLANDLHASLEWDAAVTGVVFSMGSPAVLSEIDGKAVKGRSERRARSEPAAESRRGGQRAR